MLRRNGVKKRRVIAVSSFTTSPFEGQFYDNELFQIGRVGEFDPFGGS